MQADELPWEPIPGTFMYRRRNDVISSWQYRIDCTIIQSVSVEALTDANIGDGIRHMYRNMMHEMVDKLQAELRRTSDSL